MKTAKLQLILVSPMPKNKNLSKKALAGSVEQLTKQFADLNSRLNNVSYEKLKQTLQINKHGEDNVLFWQHLRELQEHYNQLSADEKRLTEQWQKLSDQIQSAESRAGSASEQQMPLANFERLEGEVASLKTEQQDHSTRLKEVRQYLKRLANKIDDMRRETADITTHIRNLEENESELEIRDSTYETQVYDLQGNVAELEKKLERQLSQTKNSSIHSPRQPLEINGLLQQKIEQLEDQQTQFTSLHKALEGRLLDLSTRIGETNARTQFADTRVDNQQERAALLQQTLEERIGGLESMMTDLKALSDQEEDKQARDALEQQLEQIAAHIPSLEEAIEELQSSILPKADIMPLNARISGSETALTQQRKEIGGLTRQLDELSGQLATQGQAAARIDGLAEQLQILQGDNEATREHGGTLESQLHELREHVAAEQGSLDLRLNALLGEVEDNKHAQQQTEQQLTGLESRFQGRLQDLDELQAEQQRLIQAGTENQQQRFLLLEQGMQTLEQDQAGLQSGQQELASQQIQQAEDLQGVVAEASKHQVDSKRLNLDLTQLHGQVENLRSIDWRQTLAIAGSFLLVLLVGIGVYQILQKKLDDTERGLVEKINQQNEIHVSRQELEQRLQAGVESSAGDAQAIDAAQLVEMQQAQQQLTARLNDLQERLITIDTGDPATNVDGANTKQRLVKVEEQGQVALERQQALDTRIEQLQQTLRELRKDLQNRTLPAGVQQWRDWAAARAYSIQLIGASDRGSLLAYAAQSELDGERAILHTQREGDDWYTLLYGLYPTVSDARQALAALPETLRRYQPWIRLLPKQGEFTPF